MPGDTENTTTQTVSSPRDIPLWISWLLPLVIVILPYLLKPFVEDDTFTYWMYSEFGLLENVTVVSFLVAAYSGFQLFRQRDIAPVRRFKWWWLLLAIGCFIIAGEEVSWGQHFVGWKTPEAWSELNPEQNETNIHNLGRLVNDYPQAVLNLLTIVGGLIVPLYFKIKRAAFTPQQAAFWFWPSFVAVPVAALTILTKVPRRIAKDILDMEQLPYMLKRGAEETQECLIALFLMIYLYSAYTRARNLREARESEIASSTPATTE